VLLIRERHSDGRSFWTLPGGGVEPGESLVDGLRRELAEELRCDPVVGDTVATFWYAHLESPHTISRYTAFSCAIPGDVWPVRSEGILESAWIAPDELPARTLPQVRFLLRGGARHPYAPSPVPR
jgi:8-oxo-dGTP diphosphatase